MQFCGLEGPARQTGRCQLGSQVDGAAQAEGSAATHSWMATKPRLPLTQTPLAGCGTPGWGPVAVDTLPVALFPRAQVTLTLRSLLAQG